MTSRAKTISAGNLQWKIVTQRLKAETILEEASEILRYYENRPRGNDERTASNEWHLMECLDRIIK